MHTFGRSVGRTAGRERKWEVFLGLGLDEVKDFAARADTALVLLTSSCLQERDFAQASGQLLQDRIRDMCDHGARMRLAHLDDTPDGFHCYEGRLGVDPPPKETPKRDGTYVVHPTLTLERFKRDDDSFDEFLGSAHWRDHRNPGSGFKCATRS